MNAPFPPPVKTTKIEALLILEARVREATSLTELQFIIANETRKLIPCNQIIIHRGSPIKVGWKIEKISSISQVNRNAPLVKYLHTEIKRNLNKEVLENENAIVINFKNGFEEQGYAFDKALYLPFKNIRKIHLGGMTILSDRKLSQQDIALAIRLSNTYAHAWSALKPPSKTGWGVFSKRNFVITACLLFLAGFIPVPLTVLAPVEIVALNAFVVAAPIEGVIDQVHISPNAQVNKGDLLLSYNPIDLKNRLEITSRNMGIANARYSRARQSAFGSGEGRRELAITKAEYELAIEEKRFAKEQLDLVEIKSPRDGIVLFSNKDDWIGKPVVVGERIMRVANPDQIEFKIKIPASDSIILSQETTARIFLDADPLNPFEAKITVKSYTTEKSTGDPLSFPMRARLDEAENYNLDKLRIGLRGTAQISGDTVPLAFNILRKPLSAIRQYLGI